MKRKIYILAADAKQGLLALALILFACTANSQTYTMMYTGGVQTLTLNMAGKWGIECWGANGGSITSVGGAGIGGYSYGELNLSSGVVMNVFVGGRGQEASGLLTGNSG